MKRFLVQVQSTHNINTILITVLIDGKRIEQQCVVLPQDGKVHVWCVEGGDVQIYEQIYEVESD